MCIACRTPRHTYATTYGQSGPCKFNTTSLSARNMNEQVLSDRHILSVSEFSRTIYPFCSCTTAGQVYCWTGYGALLILPTLIEPYYLVADRRHRADAAIFCTLSSMIEIETQILFVYQVSWNRQIVLLLMKGAFEWKSSACCSG